MNKTVVIRTDQNTADVVEELLRAVMRHTDLGSRKESVVQFLRDYQSALMGHEPRRFRDANNS